MIKKATLIKYTLITVLLLTLSGSLSAADPHIREQELLVKLKSSKLSESEKIILWYNLASVYVGYKNNEARKYASKLLEYENDLSRQYGVMIMAGITINEAQYDSSEVFLNEAKETFHLKFSDDFNMGSTIYNRLGHLKTVKSTPDAAIKNYLEALKYCEKIKDYAQMCAVCTNIAYLYGQVGADDNVKLKYSYKALQYAEKSNDPWALEQAYSTLGNTLQEADSIQKALIYQIKGLELSREMKSEQKECFAALNIGCTYISLEKWTDAEKYFLYALKLAVKNNYKRPETYILSCLSDVYRGLKKYDLSEKYLKEAFEKKDALTEPEQLEINIAALKLSVAKGDIAEFEKQFDVFLEQQEKIHNTSSHEKMAELELKYETEKKETRIESLVKEKKYYLWISGFGVMVLVLTLVTLFYRNRLVKNQKLLAEKQVEKLSQEKRLIATQSVLEGETAERSRLARDLHDGLGGMLSVVRLNLKDIKVGGFIENEDVNRYDRALGLLDESIKELRRVAHHMMPESLLRYGIKASLNDFCNDIPNMRFHYFGNDKRLDSNLEILIYRSAHELVNNALKHSEASHINLQVVQESDRISITVQDDGKGFNPDNIKSGMGLENIRKRVESFDGKMSIYSSPENGTEINIEFQIKVSNDKG